MNKFDKFKILLKKAKYYYRIYEYDIALEYINEAISFDLSLLDIQIIDANSLKGKIMQSIGKYSESIVAFNKVLKLDPLNNFIYESRLFSLLELFPAYVLEYCDKLIQDGSNDGKTIIFRGCANNKLQNYKQAINDFNNAKQCEDYDLLIYSNRGLSRLKLNNYDQAIDDFDKALEIYPGDIKNLFNRGFANYLKKEFILSKRDFDDVLENNPFYKKGHYYRGLAYMGFREYEKAIKDFNIEIYINKNDSKTYFYRGCSYYYLNEFKKAEIDFSKANNIDVNIFHEIKKFIEKKDLIL